MFLSPNIPALFKKGTLKLTTNDDGETRRVAEATLVIEPFPVDLARQLGEEIAAHLFDDEDAIRGELESIDLRVRAGLQNVTVRTHEELEPIAILSPASIKDVSATLVEDKKSQRCWLAFSFVVVFSLEDKAARNFVLDHFGRALYWSFEAMQRDLLEKARMKETVAGLTGRAGSGITTTISSGGKSVTITAEEAEAMRADAKELRKQANKGTH